MPHSEQDICWVQVGRAAETGQGPAARGSRSPERLGLQRNIAGAPGYQQQVQGHHLQTFGRVSCKTAAVSTMWCLVLG